MGDVLTLPREVLRSRRKRVVRAKVESMKRMPKFRLSLIQAEADADLAAVGDFFSPTTRGDCGEMSRPCPHVSCKHHLYLDVSRATGAVKRNFPDLEVWELPESCALDIADRGEQTLETVAELTNVTRERIRQMEERALARLTPAQRAILREFLGHRPQTVSLAEQMEEAGGGGGGSGAGVEDHVDWREEREQEDLLDAARTGSIAGHLMNAFRLPLRVALARASEYAEEFPGGMPEGVAIEMPEEARFDRSPMATPPERRSEPPKSVEHLIPRERGGEPDLLDERARMGGFEDEEALSLAGEDAAPRIALLAPPRRLSARNETTPATEPEKDLTMTWQDEVFEALKAAGNATAAELAKKMGAESTRVSNALSNLLRAGRVDRHGGHKGAHWEVGTGKSVREPSQTATAVYLRQKRANGPKSLADVAKKVACKQANKAKANGHASVRVVSLQASGATGAVNAALDALAAALTQDFDAKMGAIRTLRGG